MLLPKSGCAWKQPLECVPAPPPGPGPPAAQMSVGHPRPGLLPQGQAQQTQPGRPSGTRAPPEPILGGDQGTRRLSYLRRPCGPLPADSPHGTHSGQDPGVPGMCACSRHSGLHTGFSLQAWDRREEIRVGGGGPWQIQGTWPRASREAPPGALALPSISNLTGGAVGLPPPRCGSPGDTPENRAGCQSIPPQTLLDGARCP